METPVCSADLKSGELCTICKRKISEGKMSLLDVEISKVLYQINERQNISQASFYKSVDLGKAALILTRGEAGVLIGRQGKIVSEISSAIGKKVRVVKTSGDIKKTVADILSPAKLIGINKAFQPGKEIIKVRVSKKSASQLLIEPSAMESVLSSFLEGEVKISFE